jgi:DNA (cytosine-5)-methyltransferase 1
MSSLTFGSLFTGIGGFDLGFERAGMECKWQVEIDEACNKVLQKHWPNIARYKDVREVGKSNLESVDIICGGFPCQDVSFAGTRKGLTGKRSTLWGEYFRIICEIRPKWIVVENVRGLLSSDDGKFFGKILRELASVGYDAEWEMFSAAQFNAPHIRERIIILAYPASVRGETGSYIIKKSNNRASKRALGKEYQYWQHVWIKPKLDLQTLIRDLSAVRTLRSYDGVSGGVDRLKQCGNAVVPQMAEWIGKRIVEVSND